MIARLSAVTAWLSVGHAVLLALFWLLLSVPESNVAMLLVSALSVLAMALVFGVVEGGGLLAWDATHAPTDLPSRALRAVPGTWLAALLFAVVWWATGTASTWWQGHRGEIDAFMMAEIDWSDTRRLHDLAAWVFAFVSYVLGLSLALAMATALLRRGLRALLETAWLREAFSPRRLLVMTGILLLFIWLPWKGVTWRPAWLAPNWQETTFVVVKLGVLFVVANIGWALVLGTAGADPRLYSSQLRPWARRSA